MFLEGNRNSFSSTRVSSLLIIFIQIIKKDEEKPLGAVNSFTTGNYHCKPLMTDVIVIHMLLLFIK